jgi:hypothetical protein
MTSTITLVVTFLLGALTAWLTSYFNYLFARKQTYRNDAIASYRDLMGIRVVIRQIVVFRFEAMINSDFHQAAWEFEGRAKDSLNLDELRRWMLKSEDYADQLTRQLQELFSVLGSISLLFKNDEEIQGLVDKIYKYKAIATKYPTNIPAKELEAWKKEAISQLQEVADREYGKPIHNLLTAIKLKAEI